MTIAQQLKVKDFPFEIKDKNGNDIYFENSNGYWAKREYDTNGKFIYHENSNGYWEKREYDASGKLIYFEDSNGSWTKREYDASGKLIYFEDSNGEIEDKRPKTVSDTPRTDAPCLTWFVTRITLPSVGKWVLTHGSYGYVVACRERDGKWRAQYVDYETGEPWLQGGDGEPDYWMPLPPPP